MTSDQRQHGLWSLLRVPYLYNLVEIILGSDRSFRRFLGDYVQPSPAAHVLDLGCGTGTALAYLPADVTYVGYDISAEYIRHAQETFGARGKFYCARINDVAVEPELSFDIVLAIALLHHLNDEEAKRVFEIAAAALRPGGCLCTIDPVLLPQQNCFARMLISRDRGRHVRTPDAYRKLGDELFNQCETHVVHDLLRVPYTHFIMKCTNT